MPRVAPRSNKQLTDRVIRKLQLKCEARSNLAMHPLFIRIHGLGQRGRALSEVVPSREAGVEVARGGDTLAHVRHEAGLVAGEDLPAHLNPRSEKWISGSLRQEPHCLMALVGAADLNA